MRYYRTTNILNGADILTDTRSAVVGFVGVNEFRNLERRDRMKTKIVTIVVVLILAALPLGVAFADAKGPNASQFGPASCEDGTQFEVVVSPSSTSVVGQDTGSTRLGVAMSVSLFAPDGTLVETFFDKPGNQPTLWCTWDDPNVLPGFYLGGDILLTPAKP